MAQRELGIKKPWGSRKPAGHSGLSGAGMETHLHWRARNMLRSIRRTLGNISALPGTTTCVEVAAQVWPLRERWMVLLGFNFHSSHSPRPSPRSAPHRGPAP